MQAVHHMSPTDVHEVLMLDAGSRLLTTGITEIGFSREDGITRLSDLYQRDPLRVLFPTPAAGDPALAVIVTTSGGLVAGDRLDIAVTVAPGAAAHVTAAAAEKIYRSVGRTTTISQAISIGTGATLEFVLPETILFDGARLRRETSIDVAPGSAFLCGDIVVLGRRARGERFTSGLLREVWEVRRSGELVWGDALHLEDDIARIVDDPACLDGAAAFATMILCSPRSDTRSILDRARDIQRADAAGSLRAGLTTIAGLVIARWLATDTALLRQAYTDLICHFRSTVLGLPPRLPRIWHV
jgi:urease accessory protein